MDPQSLAMALVGVLGKCPVQTFGDLWKDGWEMMWHKAVPDRRTTGTESQARKEPNSVCVWGGGSQ